MRLVEMLGIRDRGRWCAHWMLVVVILCMGGKIIPAVYASNFEDQMKQAIRYIESNDWGRLAEHAEKMTHERPDNLWANYYAGLGFTNSGQLEKGEGYLLKALEQDASQFWPNYVLFYNWSRQNRKGALEQAEKVEKMIPPEVLKNSPGEIKYFYLEFARRTSNLKDQKKTREIIERALKKLPGEPLLKVQLAGTYFMDDKKKWEKLARETLSLVPKAMQTANLVYQLPLRGERIKIHQGNNETVSHLGLQNGYSWDFVMVDVAGRYASDPAKKESHYVFGQKVYAAQDGMVWSVYDQSPDTEPNNNNPDYGENTISIQHSGGEMSVYVHLKKGSALVKTGDKIIRGQPIALVGCSGRFVDIPHLHFGVYRDGYSIEAKLSGFSAAPYVPKKDELLRSRWEQGGK